MAAGGGAIETKAWGTLGSLPYQLPCFALTCLGGNCHTSLVIRRNCISLLALVEPVMVNIDGFCQVRDPGIKFCRALGACYLRQLLLVVKLTVH